MKTLFVLTLRVSVASLLKKNPPIYVFLKVFELSAEQNAYH